MCNKKNSKMGFNKRFISKESLQLYAKNDDYVRFFNYFKCNALLFDDDFSMKIAQDISKCTIDNKDEIIKIMNRCK